jgi:hypothetical protein
MKHKHRPWRWILAAVPVLFWAGCGSGVGDTSGAGIPQIENALQMEISFGDQNLPGEYLLADPQGIAVNDRSEILVADEHHVKIFNVNGEPLERLGGQGQGPGEFQEPSNPVFGPTGHLSVGSSFSEFNIYRADNSYLEKYQGRADLALRDLNRRENLTFGYVTHMVALDEQRRIFHLFGRNRNLPGLFPVFKYLLLSDAESLEVLVKHHSRAYVLNNKGGSSSSPYLGSLHWTLLDAGGLLYAQTHQNGKAEGRPESEYVLNILNTADRSVSRIPIPYDPTPIPPSLKRLETQHFREINLTVEPPPNLQELLNKLEFFPAFKALRTDGDLVFVFKFHPGNEELESSIEKAEREGEEIPEGIYNRFQPYNVDVVDSASGRLAARAQFSCIPDVIKDGRAYRLFKPADDFPRVERYRVNPEVYQAGRREH